jgi:WD40 repeat protein
VTFSPDGRYLLVDDVGGEEVKGWKNHTIRIWDAQPGAKKGIVEKGIVGRHGQNVWCLAFSHDGRRLVSASNDGSVKFWHWDPERLGRPRQPLLEVSARFTGFGNCAAFSPDDRRLVTVAEEHTFKVWDARTGDLLQTLRGHTGDVYAVAFSPDGRWLASAGDDSTVKVWDAKSWKLRHTLRGHTGLVMSLAFSPDSRSLVSGSRDHTVKVWDMTRWETVPQDK